MEKQQIRLYSPVQGSLVGTQVKGIEAEVSRQGAVQVGGRGASRLPQGAGNSVNSHGAASLQTTG
jgi:hypothetical protein